MQNSSYRQNFNRTAGQAAEKISQKAAIGLLALIKGLLNFIKLAVKSILGR